MGFRMLHGPAGKKRIHLQAEDALFFFVNKVIPPTSATMASYTKNIMKKTSFYTLPTVRKASAVCEAAVTE
ncbi:hypothetical protein A6R68_13096, partial [Neotoma lepida]